MSTDISHLQADKHSFPYTTSMIVYGTPWMIKRYRVSVRVTLQLAAYGSEAGMERTSVHNLWPIGGFVIRCPGCLEEDHLPQYGRFLRIPEISSARNHRHAIENLKRNHGLPRVHLCGKTVYLTDSVKAWLEKHVTCGQ